MVDNAVDSEITYSTVGTVTATSLVELSIMVDDAGSWSAKGDSSRKMSA